MLGSRRLSAQIERCGVSVRQCDVSESSTADDPVARFTIDHPEQPGELALELRASDLRTMGPVRAMVRPPRGFESVEITLPNQVARELEAQAAEAGVIKSRG